MRNIALAREKLNKALSEAQAGNLEEAQTLLSDGRQLAEKHEDDQPPRITLTADQARLLVARQRELEQQLQEVHVRELVQVALTRGAPPAVVEMAKRILMACQREAEPTILLGGDQSALVNLFGAVAALLETVPGRIGNVLTAPPPNTPPASDKKMTPEEAEQLARRRRKELGIVSSSIGVEL